MLKILIPELLEARGWNPSELARRSGGRISTATAYRMAENSCRSFKPQQIVALCQAFDVQPGELFRLRVKTRR